MEKAYEVKALFNSVKAELPEIGEETLKVVLKHLFPWLQESAKLSETSVDDWISVAYPMIQAQLVEVAEEINPADNA